jgi:hypothetical protein
LLHEAPSFLQVAPVPPQTPLEQSLLQHSPLEEHDLPSAEQLGVAQMPLAQLPLQQSLDEEQLSPDVPQDAVDEDDPLGAMQTPEQARLQQSDQELQVTPTDVQDPPAPPSPVSHASVAGVPAQPRKIATSVPRVSDVVSFMPEPFRNPHARSVQTNIGWKIIRLSVTPVPAWRRFRATRWIRGRRVFP